MYLLIHTLTITECDYVLQAQFFHAVALRARHNGVEGVQPIARRMRLRMNTACNGGSRMKASLLHATCPNLKTLMKTSKGNVRHHLRAIKIGNQNQVAPFQNVQMDEKTMASLSPASSHHSDKPEVETGIMVDTLLPGSNLQQTVQWLNTNRFEKFVQTFANFSGADMLRMSRDDLIQICGHADGIRLYNGLHSKTVAPKLTLYVCKENSTVFNAIYLSRLNNYELVQKLALFLDVCTESIKDIYVHGPQMIHVQLNAEMMQHIKDETMFNVEIIQNNGNSDGRFVVLLKPINKTV